WRGGRGGTGGGGRVGWWGRAPGSAKPSKAAIPWKVVFPSSAKGGGPGPARSPPDGHSMRRIIAQARKELTQLLRDPLALGLALVLPLGLTALMGTTVSLTVSDIPIVIQDMDQTPLSRQYADAFRSSITFRVIGLPVDASPETALTSGRARGALIIPEHFARDVLRGRNAEAQLLVDAADTNTALITKGNAAQVTTVFASGL